MSANQVTVPAELVSEFYSVMQAQAKVTLSIDPHFRPVTTGGKIVGIIVEMPEGPGAAEEMAPQVSGGAGEVAPPPRVSSKRSRTPAELFYLNDCHDTDFQMWCEAVSAEQTKSAIKTALGFESLSTITQAQVNAIRRFYARGGAFPGLAAHMTTRGLALPKKEAQ